MKHTRTSTRKKPSGRSGSWGETAHGGSQGTFRLDDEPVYLPRQQIREEMERAGSTGQARGYRHGQALFFDE